MAVTDLSGAPDLSALPWWARGANMQPPSGGPTPPGARGMTSWYDYLASMMTPIGTAIAAEAPAPDGGFDRSRAVDLTQPRPITPPAPPAPPTPPVARADFSRPNQGGGYPAPAGQPTVPFSAPMQGGGPAYAGAAPGPPPQPPYNVLSGGSANTGLPVAPAAAPAAAAPVQGPLAAQGQPRFGTFSYQNPNSTRNAPIYTALNLGGLFGRGANPANVPAANAQPVSGPLARGGPMPQATVNRLMANYPGRINASPDQVGSYIRTQPWVQNLSGGRQAPTAPDAAADAYWRNLMAQRSGYQ